MIDKDSWPYDKKHPSNMSAETTGYYQVYFKQTETDFVTETHYRMTALDGLKTKSPATNHSLS